MKEQITLLGIPFQVYTVQTLYEESCNLLEEAALHTIYFIEAEQCATIANEGLLPKVTYYVATSRSMANAFPKRYRKVIQEFSVKDYVMKMCEYAVDMGSDVVLWGRSRSRVQSIAQEIQQIHPYLPLERFAEEDMISKESLINEVNAYAPEILILGIDPEDIREFMTRYRHLINARLCICVGSKLYSEMFKKEKKIHTITSTRRLQRLVRMYKKKERMEHEQNKADTNN